GAPRRNQVELRQVLPLLSSRDQRRGPVQVIDDLEDRLFPFVRGGARRQQPSDSQVHLGARGFRNQRIRGFLNTVVNELVGAVQRFDQSLTDAFPKNLVHLLRRCVQGGRERRDLRDVS